MPLPSAPSKRADRLTAKDFEASARGASSRTRPPAIAAKEEKLAETEALAKPGKAKAVATPKAATKTGVTAEKKSSGGKTSPAARAPKADPVSAPAAVAVPTTSKASPVASVRPSKRITSTGPAKLFVLDTNVLLHDPMCLFRFEEHDIFLPMIVLEELDGHKKGMTEVARNARQTSRTLDALAAAPGADITAGFALDSTGHGEARGKLLFQTQPLNYALPTSLPQGKADNQILGVVEALRSAHAPREVVLVSKDINMRVKARALGLGCDDYQNDKTLEDGDLLYSGSLALPTDFWATHGQSSKARTLSTKWMVRSCPIC